MTDEELDALEVVCAQACVFVATGAEWLHKQVPREHRRVYDPATVRWLVGEVRHLREMARFLESRP